MNVPGKTVLVTGGAGGIGRAITEYLAASGVIVGVLDKNGDGIAETLHAAGNSGFKCFGYTVDIRNYAEVKVAVECFVKDSQAPIYGLVNNAGWDKAGSFVESTPEFWDKVLDINLKGPLNVTHACLSSMLAGGVGRVVSIASDAGRVGSSGEAVYSAAKGGIIALMKTLAREHTRHGITFNSICPGPTDTPFLAEFDQGGDGTLVKALEKAIPMRRLAQPSDYPALVAYFLSEEAAYVTGQTISVSGGLTMHG